MATSKKPRRSKVAPLEELPRDLVDDVAAQISAKGSLPLKKLTTVKLAPAAAAELQERLIRRGFDRTAKVMRRLPGEQLEALLTTTPRVPLAGLGKRLAGVSQTEAKTAAFELVRSGRAHLVVVGGKDHLTMSSGDVLAPGDVTRARAAVDALARLLKLAAPKKGQPPRSLLASEVRERSSSLLSLVGGAAPSAVRAGPAEADTAVVDAVEALEASDPLVFIPDVVDRLAASWTPEQVLQALSRLSQSGALELRPESGIRTLSPGEAVLCLPGPQGTVLSYVRRLEGGMK